MHTRQGKALGTLKLKTTTKSTLQIIILIPKSGMLISAAVFQSLIWAAPRIQRSELYAALDEQTQEQTPKNKDEKKNKRFSINMVDKDLFPGE